MKMLLSIISNDDSAAVQAALTSEGFFMTKLATTGGFLKAGNTTFLMGVNDNEVDKVLAIIGKYSKKRKTVLPSTMPTSSYSGIPTVAATAPVEVTVGGATIFILNIERFEKM